MNRARMALQKELRTKLSSHHWRQRFKVLELIYSTPPECAGRVLASGHASSLKSTPRSDPHRHAGNGLDRNKSYSVCSIAELHAPCDHYRLDAACRRNNNPLQPNRHPMSLTIRGPPGGVRLVKLLIRQKVPEPSLSILFIPVDGEKKARSRQTS
jgi:hypothetical protein